MRLLRQATLFALIIFCSSAAFSAAPALTPGDTTIGKDLQTYTTVVLGAPAPVETELTLTSSDPSKLLLSKTPDVAGTPSIKLTVRPRFRESQDFWLHALGDSGEVTYTASAPGYETGKGTVKLAHSGIIVTGPYGEGATKFVTTPRGWPTKITLRTVRLDGDLNKVEQQFVRGGITLDLKIASSNSKVGGTPGGPFSIPAASDTVYAEFQPSAAGETELTAVAPPGFRLPAKFGKLEVTVRKPGLAVADDLVIGENLQITATLSLGEPAPEGGLTVTIKSNDPSKLLLSETATGSGKPSITVNVPAKAVNAKYYVQALARSGDVTHTASAPGYTDRTGSLMLVASGVIISLDHHGPPDEAEVFRPESAGNEAHAFVANLTDKKNQKLILYTAFLDPVSRRAADISVQALRGGLSVPVELKNSAPEVASVASRVILKGGDEKTFTPFTAGSPGIAVIAVKTPEGFLTSTNYHEIHAIVK